MLGCVAVLLTAFGVLIVVSINKDLTKLRKEAEKYQAQDAHACEQQRLRV